MMLVAARGWQRRLLIVIAGGLLPVAYQVFRMGYYGLLVPGTAIAKDATGSKWQQGFLYLANFNKPYMLWAPVMLLAAIGLVLYASTAWVAVALAAVVALAMIEYFALGDAIGHWEDDTLVVDVIGFNDRTWLDQDGHPHTEMLHVVERYKRIDELTLKYEFTIDDPGAYSAPWSNSYTIPWAPGAELYEYICQENNQFLLDLKDDFGNPFFKDVPTTSP